MGCDLLCNGLQFFSQSARVCNGELTLQDLNTGHTFEIPQSDLDIVESNITFTTNEMMVNRYYLITIRIENSAGPFTSNAAISKPR